MLKENSCLKEKVEFLEKENLALQSKNEKLEKEIILTTPMNSECIYSKYVIAF